MSTDRTAAALCSDPGLTSARLRLDVHGFGPVVLGEGAWMALAAVQLRRSPGGRDP